MTLAHLISRKAESDKIASIGIQLAAAAKEKVKEAGESVSDAVIAEAVIQTKDNLIKAAQSGQQMTGGAIGADLLANILKVKAGNKAGSEAKRSATITGQTFEGYIQGLIQASQPGSDRDILSQLVKCYRNSTDASEALQMIFNSQQAKAA